MSVDRSRRRIVGVIAAAGISAVTGFPKGKETPKIHAQESKQEEEPVPSAGDLVMIQGNYFPDGKALIRRSFDGESNFLQDEVLMPYGLHDLEGSAVNRTQDVGIITWSSEADPFDTNASIVNIKTGERINDQLFKTDRLVSGEITLSPDGKQIAFQNIRQRGNIFWSVITIFDIENNTEVDLPFTDVSEPKFHPTKPDVLLFTQYSPGASTALIESAIDSKAKERNLSTDQVAKAKEKFNVSNPNQNDYTTQVVTYDRATNTTTVVGEGVGGQWSPINGEMIAFSHYEGEHPNIQSEFRISLPNGLNVHRVLHASDPRWSPDGATVSCVRQGFISGRTAQALSFYDLKTKEVVNNDYGSLGICKANWMDPNWACVEGDWAGDGLTFGIILNKNGSQVIFPQPSRPAGEFQKVQGFVADTSKIYLAKI